MALVKGPLLSIAASGQISRTMTFRARRKLKTVSKFAVPSQPSSVAQQSQSLSFGLALNFWRTKIDPDGVRTSYGTKARMLGTGLPGYQQFMSQFGNTPSTSQLPIAWRSILRITATEYTVRTRYAVILDHNPPAPLPELDTWYGPTSTGPWVYARIQMRANGTVRIPFPLDFVFPVYAYTQTVAGVWNSGLLRFLAQDAT